VPIREAVCFQTTSIYKTLTPATSINPRSRVLLEMLVVAQLDKIVPTFYGNRIFITVFTRPHQWSLLLNIILLRRWREVYSTFPHS